MIRAGFILIIVFAGLGMHAYSQESVTQQTSPASMRWYQINTTNFKILFPEGFADQAQRVANTMEHIQEPASTSLGAKPGKISILLHNESSISNGFVTQAPRRSEFFAMPPQNYNFIGTNEWLNLLAVHEYRHIVQFKKSVTGINKGIYFLFGQLAQAGMSFVAMPQWFWEGDAVAIETAFTSSGRGRIPEFNLLMRTNYLEGREFGYHKQYLRSFKHNMPDHYPLGYHMVSYLRKKTGRPDIWSDITQRAWAVPFKPFTFSNAIKKETGLTVEKLYDEMAQHVTKNWSDQLSGVEVSDFQTLNKRTSKSYTDYFYPQVLENGSVLVLKSGIGEISQFVSLSSFGEKKEFVQGPFNDAGMLSVSQNKIVWNEFRFDPRWQTRSYSVIKTYDLSTKKQRTLTRVSRYSAAALDPDAKKVATIETNESYQIRLVVLDYETGNVLKKYENTNNEQLSMPRWNDSGSHIVFLRSGQDGKKIVRIDYHTGLEELLYDAKFENVGHPVLFKDYLFFNSPISGIDNIYCLDLSSQKKLQVTSARYGAYNPTVAPHGETIYYNDQTKDGLDVVQIPLNVNGWKNADATKMNHDLFSETLTEQEGHHDLLNSIPDKQYVSSRYHRVNGIINPHSWGAYFLNSLTQVNLGIVSRDVLSTTEISGGYTFDINERTGVWRAGISYQGMYPIIEGEFNYARREDNTGIFGRDVTFNWTEIGGSAGVRLPLLLTRSKYNTSLSVGSAIGYSQVSGFKNIVEQNGSVLSSGFGRLVPANDTLLFNFTNRASNGNLIFNRADISFVNLLKRSRRDFNPRFGQIFSAESFSTLPSGDFKGRMNVARATLYFPGLFKHHSLFFRGGYQQSLEDPELINYQFRNRLFKPRGYSYPRDTRFITLSANYAFPIVYPDISLGPIINFQRIKANLFYDYGESEGLAFLYQIRNNQITAPFVINNADTYISLGGELTFDINIFRFLPQIELGVRATYITANRFFKDDVVFEFLIGNIPF